MKNLKKMIAALGLTTAIAMTASTAKAGFLLTDLTDGDTNQPCTEKTDTSKTDWGFILTDATGVVVHGFTGIIIVGATDTPVDCGVVVHG